MSTAPRFSSARRPPDVASLFGFFGIIDPRGRHFYELRELGEKKSSGNRESGRGQKIGGSVAAFPPIDNDPRGYLVPDTGLINGLTTRFAIHLLYKKYTPLALDSLKKKDPRILDTR